MLGQFRECGRRQDVPTGNALVAQNSVEQQIDGPFAVNAQEGRFSGPLGDRFARFGEVNVGGQVGERDAVANRARFVKQRLREGAVAESAAESFDARRGASFPRLCPPPRIAARHSLQ